jgi:hypothetical protein
MVVGAAGSMDQHGCNDSNLVLVDPPLLSCGVGLGFS